MRSGRRGGRRRGAGRPALGASSAGGADSTALLARYTPVLKLYASDRKPSSIEPFLAGADLERLSAGGAWRVVRKSPSASALANGSTQLRLNTRGCSPADEPAHLLPGPGGDTYRLRPRLDGLRHVRGDHGPPVLALLSAQRLAQLAHEADGLVPARRGLGGDVGRLNPAGKPIAVALSQHNLGVNRPWARTPREGSHPVVYVALGSHANYFSRGFHGAETSRTSCRPASPASRSPSPISPPHSRRSGRPRSST